MLQGKTDPEEKRKTIGAGFIEVFRDFAITLKSKHGIRPKFLVQVSFHPSFHLIPFHSTLVVAHQTSQLYSTGVCGAQQQQAGGSSVEVRAQAPVIVVWAKQLFHPMSASIIPHP